MSQILLVEDDPQLRRSLLISLSARQFRVTQAGTGADALALALTDAVRPDLVLLDLGLPDMDGLDVLARLREFSQVPVIVLSARHSQSEKVTALEGGADDYLTKPFGLDELVARIRVAIRRAQAPARAQVVRTGTFALDFGALVATVGEREVRLTPTEWKLARALTQRVSEVVSAQDLLREVWGPTFLQQTHYLRVYFTHLRKKLEPDPEHPRNFITVPGVGYRFEP